MDPYAAYHRLARDPPRQNQGPPPGIAHAVKAETPPPTEPHRIPRPPSSATAAAYGPREVPDSDAPPNVTVSTSTIPLSMAGGPPRRRRADDLSAIVHQINRLCRARAGAGATSVCEGQIANPGPISRNLLIDASSRAAGGRAAPLPLVLPAARVQRRRAWGGGAEDEGAPPCKDPRPAECALLARTPSYICQPTEPPRAPHADRDYGPPPRGRFPSEAAGAEYRRLAVPAEFPRGRQFATGGFPNAGPRDGAAAGRPPDGACALYPAYR
ncbi:uncharacterized protein LOC144083182 [Stigmatopora argus]